MRYLQLADNEWDPATRTSRPKVLHSFGREDQLDRGAVKSLVASLSRLLDPAAALAAAAPTGLAFTSSRPLGGTHVLDHLWHGLGIDTAMNWLLAGRKLAGGTGAVRAGGEPGVGPVLEARRRRVGYPPRAHRRRTELTHAQRAIFTKLGIDPTHEDHRAGPGGNALTSMNTTAWTHA